MSFLAALNLLKQDVNKPAQSFLTFPRLRDKLTLLPASSKDLMYTFIDKEQIRAEGAARTVHRLYVYVPTAESKCVGWILTRDVDSCMICGRAFGAFTWKHHCRCCGNVVCHGCLAGEIVIMELSDLGPQPACLQCNYGQADVHAICFTVHPLTGLDKSQLAPKLAATSTLSLVRRPTGELLVRRLTGNSAATDSGASRRDSFSSAASTTDREHASSPRTPRGGRKTAHAPVGSVVPIAGGGGAAVVVPHPAFIVKTKLLPPSAGAKSSSSTNRGEAAEEASLVYVNVCYHDHLRPYRDPEVAEKEREPYLLSSCRNYSRSEHSDKQRTLEHIAVENDEGAAGGSSGLSSEDETAAAAKKAAEVQRTRQPRTPPKKATATSASTDSDSEPHPPPRSRSQAPFIVFDVTVHPQHVMPLLQRKRAPSVTSLTGADDHVEADPDGELEVPAAHSAAAPAASAQSATRRVSRSAARAAVVASERGPEMLQRHSELCMRVLRHLEEKYYSTEALAFSPARSTAGRKKLVRRGEGRAAPSALAAASSSSSTSSANQSFSKDISGRSSGSPPPPTSSSEVNVLRRLSREISFPLMNYSNSHARSGNRQNFVFRQQYLDHYIGQHVTPITVPPQPHTLSKAPMAEAGLGSQTETVVPKAGVVLRTYGSMSPPSATSPGNVAGSTSNGDLAVQAGTDTDAVSVTSKEPAVQHRVFVNVCHSDSLPLFADAKAASPTATAAGGSQLQWLLGMLASRGVYCLCSAPKLGVPVAASASAPSTPVKGARTDGLGLTPASPGPASPAVLSREIIIFDVVLASAAFRVLEEHLAPAPPAAVVPVNEKNQEGDGDGEKLDAEVAAEAECMRVATATRAAVQAAVAEFVLGHISLKHNKVVGAATAATPTVGGGGTAGTSTGTGTGSGTQYTFDRRPESVTFPKTKNGYKGGPAPPALLLRGDELLGYRALLQQGGCVMELPAVSAPVELPVPNVASEAAADATAQAGAEVEDATADGIDRLVSVGARAGVAVGEALSEAASLAAKEESKEGEAGAGLPSTGGRNGARTLSGVRTSSTGSFGSSGGKGYTQGLERLDRLLLSQSVSCRDISVDWLDLSDQFGGGSIAGHSGGSGGGVYSTAAGALHYSRSSRGSPQVSADYLQHHQLARHAFKQQGQRRGADPFAAAMRALPPPAGPKPSTPWEMLLADGERITAQGMIGKRNRVGILRRRQLILTDRPRLFYVDPETMAIKGEVEWTDDDPPYVIEVSRTTFELTTPHRTYRFTDIRNEAEYWVGAIVAAVQVAAARQEKAAALEREKFNFRSSKWVPD